MIADRLPGILISTRKIMPICYYKRGFIFIVYYESRASAQLCVVEIQLDF